MRVSNHNIHNLRTVHQNSTHEHYNRAVMSFTEYIKMYTHAAKLYKYIL